MRRAQEAFALPTGARQARPGPDGKQAEWMMQPADETELAEAIRSATEPLAIRGGGTRSAAATGGTRLDTGGLSGVVLYEPGALTLVARAGTPLEEIHALLAGEGQRLPFEPPDMRRLLGLEGTSTIGGVVATNASGPRRVQSGACRDFLIGVRFVDGNGSVAKNGGRVMKNVTGYDLVKLLAGSHGTLGVLTEVAFKVLPAPETTATLWTSGLDDAAGVRALSLALGSPFEVSGASHHGNRRSEGSMTMLRLEGFEASVAYRLERLREMLAGAGDWQVRTGSEAAGMWARIRDVDALAAPDAQGDVWRVSVRPSDAPGIAARMDAIDVLYDWGGGLIWALVAEGTDLRSRIGTFAGHATLVRASAETRARLPVFQPEPAPVAALSASLRARFDPRGILNPGLME